MFAAVIDIGILAGVVGGVFGGVIGGLAVLAWALMQPARQCPGCGALMPRVRKPANTRQMLWGGWTCPKCGVEMDRKGTRLES